MRVQHATTSKLASSTGPFLVRRAERVPKSEKNVTTLSVMVFRNFLRNNVFFGQTPAGNGNLMVFWPVLGRGYLEKFRDWANNRKTQFPGARGPEIEKKKVTTPSGMVVRNFLQFTV